MVFLMVLKFKELLKDLENSTIGRRCESLSPAKIISQLVSPNLYAAIDHDIDTLHVGTLL